jgi:hypothetical protein
MLIEHFSYYLEAQRMIRWESRLDNGSLGMQIIHAGTIREPWGMGAAVKQRKHVGRPIKAPAAKKAQVMLLVRARIKRELSKYAHDAGHTLSREGELWLEELLTYRTIFGVGPAGHRRAITTVLGDLGWRALHHPAGDIWFAPGHPNAPPPSPGFIPWEKDEEPK